MDNRSLAADVLEKAHSIIMTQRGTQHGDAENSFQMIADLWAVLLRHRHFRRTGVLLDLQISPSDVAEMMSLLKKARKTYGAQNADNHYDDVGYSALARMLSPGEVSTEFDFQHTGGTTISDGPAVNTQWPDNETPVPTHVVGDEDAAEGVSILQRIGQSVGEDTAAIHE